MLFYLGVFCCTQRDSIKFFGVQGLGNTCCSEPFLFHGKSLCTVVLGSYQNNIPKKVRLNKGPVPSQLFGIIGYSTVQYWFPCPRAHRKTDHNSSDQKMKKVKMYNFPGDGIHLIT